MSKNIQIEELLKNNKRLLLDADPFFRTKENGICVDGIVHEATFEKMPLKLAFLLKDTNSNDGKGVRPENPMDWPYRDWLEYKQSVMPTETPAPKERRFYGKTFNKLTMWAESFFCASEGKEKMKFEEFEKSFLASEEAKRNALRKIAIVNIKKTWGTSSITNNDLTKYLEYEGVQGILERELEIIQPNVVICGNTYWLVKDKFIGKEDELTLSNGNRVKYFQWKGIKFLEFYHPANRKKTEEQYYYAWDILEALFKK